MDQPSDEPQVRQIYLAARAIEDPSARKQYLDETCTPELRATVDALLAANASPTRNPLMNAIDRVEREANDMPPQEIAQQILQQTRVDFGQTDTSVDASTLPQIDGYELLSVLGKGGMGTVYHAKQCQPFARDVAIKVINPGMDSLQVLKRFELEKQALALMDHSNIATIFDAGQTRLGYPYFAMELVQGVSIDQYCIDRQLPLADRLELFIEVCSAVHHAHQRGILHRDLKPSNVIVKKSDSRATSKVIDFGIAKSLTEDAADRTQFTRLEQWVGTPMYMSPEQVTAEPQQIDVRSDVYELGALLYLLVTGEPPFTKADLDGSGLDAVREMICEREPLRPSLRFSKIRNQKPNEPFIVSTVAPQAWHQELASGLDWIILKCLEKMPNERYATAQQLADDVRRFLQHAPVEAAPPTLGYQLRKFVRRKQSTLARIAASIVILAITISAVELWQRAQHTEWETQQLRNSNDQIAAEARAQERKAFDLQEATRLRQLLQARRDNNFARMSELSLPREADGSFLRTPGSEDTATHRSLRRILTSLSNPQPERVFEHPDAVTDAMLSPDRKLLATSCRDGWLRLWKLDSDEPPQQFGPIDDPIESLTFSPDGDRIVCGDQDGAVHAWHIATGDRFGNFEQAQEGGIESLAWSPDGRWLAAGIRYDHVRIVRADNLETAWRIEHEGPEIPPRYESLLFSSDSRKLYLAAREPVRGVQVWDIASRTRDRTIATTFLGYPRSFCFAGKQQQWLVVGDRPQATLLVMDTESGRQLTNFEAPFAHAQALAYSATGERLAAAYLSGIVVVWKLTEDANGRPRFEHDLTIAAHDASKGKTTKVLLMERGQILTAGEDGRACLWSLDENRATSRRIGEMLATHAVDSHEHIAIEKQSERQELLVVRHSERHAQSLLMELPRLPIPMDEVSSWRFPFLRVSGGIMAVCDNRQVYIWRLQEENWEQAQAIEVADHILAISLEKHGKKLAVMGTQKTQVFESNDGWATFSKLGEWNEGHAVEGTFVEDGTKLLLWYRTSHGSSKDKHIVEERDSRTGHLVQEWTGDPLTFAVSENEQMLALASESDLRVINRKSGQTVLSVKGINPVAKTFCDGDRILLVWHADSTIRAWHLPTGEALGVVHKATKELRILKQVVFGPPGEDFVQFWFDSFMSANCVTIGNGAPRSNIPFRNTD